MSTVLTTILLLFPTDELLVSNKEIHSSYWSDCIAGKGNNNWYHAIYLNFYKAFDTVPQIILVSELKA